MLQAEGTQVSLHLGRVSCLTLQISFVGMAGLIGKAAALHWKKATFGEIDSEKKSSVDWRQESMRIREKRLQEEHDQSDAQQLEASEDPPVDQVEEETDSVQGGFQHTSADMSVRLYNPNKQRLAQLGKLAPSNVSNNLRRELAQRSRLESILRSMEKMIQRQGPARRLGKTDSRKITRALNRSMLKGASRQVMSFQLHVFLKEDLSSLSVSPNNTSEMFSCTS